MKALAVLLFCLPSVAFAGSGTEEARGRLTIQGTIQSSCNVYLNTLHPLARPMEALRYHMASPQIVAEVILTCNRGDETVSVTYESVNGGLLGADGNLMEYEKSLSGGREVGLASAGPWTVAQRVGPRSQFLRVRPLSTGVIQGPYSDVIVVSVSSN